MIATALMAVSTFQVVYGGEARMYALLQLLGVAAAIVTERWLRRPQPWHMWAIGGLLLVALFDHISGVLLARRAAGGRRRAARPRRVALAARARGRRPGLARRVGAVDARPARHRGGRRGSRARRRRLRRNGVAAGHVGARPRALRDRGGRRRRRDPLQGDRMLGRVWIALGVVPFALAAVIGLFAPFLFDRTLTLSSWAPIIAVASRSTSCAAASGSSGRGSSVVARGDRRALVLVPGVEALGGRRHGRPPRAGRAQR